VAFSPDGARLAATASEDRTARVGDAASGEELAVLREHTDQVVSVAFSPDGGRLATASGDGTARVWDAASGKQLALLEGHTDKVWSVTFSPDGARLATASFDHTARVWDPASGKELADLTGHTDYITAVAFSPDGGRLATASGDNTARVWIAREKPEDQAKRRQFWRERQAADAERDGRWFAAAFHLGQLIRERPADAALYARRGLAYAFQGQWGKAAADLLQGAALCHPR
jgi:predicted NACHT family NTPase